MGETQGASSASGHFRGFQVGQEIIDPQAARTPGYYDGHAQIPQAARMQGRSDAHTSFPQLPAEGYSVTHPQTSDFQPALVKGGYGNFRYVQSVRHPDTYYPFQAADGERASSASDQFTGFQGPVRDYPASASHLQAGNVGGSRYSVASCTESPYSPVTGQSDASLYKSALSHSGGSHGATLYKTPPPTILRLPSNSARELYLDRVKLEFGLKLILIGPPLPDEALKRVMLNEGISKARTGPGLDESGSVCPCSSRHDILLKVGSL